MVDLELTDNKCIPGTSRHLITPAYQTISKRHLAKSSQSRTTVTTSYCFKTVSLGVVCYTAIGMGTEELLT